MKIGEAAAQSGVAAKSIRHYEAIGLLRSAPRQNNSYRVYDERDVHELRFIRRGRKLGFSIREIGALLTLWRDKGRSSRDARRVAAAHLSDLEARIEDMTFMAAALRALVDACHGDERPDCPILTDLMEGADDPEAADHPCGQSSKQKKSLPARRRKAPARSNPG